MPRLLQPFNGTPMLNPPTGFPVYMGKQHPRIVTANIWYFFRHAIVTKLGHKKQKEALAFLEQAFEFFEAARNPRLSCRPLLHYYSFLNLAKVFLLLKHVAIAIMPRHGISDPKVNFRQRLHLEGQSIRFPKCARNHSELFPEFVTALGGTVSRATSIKVISLLRQIPGIHRTFCRVVKVSPSFIPVKSFYLIRADNNFCVRMILDKANRDVRLTLTNIRARQAFRSIFHQVEAEDVHEVWFETNIKQGIRRGIYSAIRNLAQDVRNVGVWSILTSTGWRYYLGNVHLDELLPPLASVYATMFYLGSITRYKPYDFDKLFTGKFAWIVSEFLQTQPIQFIYGLAGKVAGVDVVRPFGAFDE